MMQATINVRHEHAFIWSRKLASRIRCGRETSETGTVLSEENER